MEHETRETEMQVLLATSDGLLALEPTPGSSPSGSPMRLLDGDVTAVHADGADLWALVDRVDLHHLAPDRADELVAKLEGGRGAVVHVHGEHVFVGGDRGRLWRLEGHALVEVTSFAGAPTHDEWHTPWGGPPDVFSMASAEGELFVGVHVGGILASADDAHTWRATIDLHDDVHQVVARAGRLFAATGRRALAESSDGGRSWSYHHTGLHATYALAVAATDAGVLVGVSSHHGAHDGAIRLYDGAGFQRPEGLPDDLHGAVGPRQIVAIDNRAALATPGGEVYASEDGGRSWTLLAERIPHVSEIALRITSAPPTPARAETKEAT